MKHLMASPLHFQITLLYKTQAYLQFPEYIRVEWEAGRAFRFQALHLWNQLPEWVQEADILSTFKKFHLKPTFLLNPICRSG